MEPILVGLIAGLILESLVIILMFRYFLTKDKRAENKELHLIRTNAISRESVKIPVTTSGITPDNTDPGYLFGEIYRSRNTPARAPYIIVIHGSLSRHDDVRFEQFGGAFALAGYAALSFDLRCHGRSTAGSFKKNGVADFVNLLNDINTVIDYVLARPDLDGNRIGVIGVSLGGSVALYHPLNNPNVKIIITACTAYDSVNLFSRAKSAPLFSIQRLFYYLAKHNMHWTIPELEVHRSELSLPPFVRQGQDYSGKVFITHCRDDQVVPFQNCTEIAETLHLPQENQLIFEHGGHTFNYMQSALLAQVLKWCSTHL